MFAPLVFLKSIFFPMLDWVPVSPAIFILVVMELLVSFIYPTLLWPLDSISWPHMFFVLPFALRPLRFYWPHVVYFFLPQCIVAMLLIPVHQYSLAVVHQYSLAAHKCVHWVDPTHMQCCPQTSKHHRIPPLILQIDMKYSIVMCCLILVHYSILLIMLSHFKTVFARSCNYQYTLVTFTCHICMGGIISTCMQMFLTSNFFISTDRENL